MPSEMMAITQRWALEINPSLTIAKNCRQSVEAYFQGNLSQFSLIIDLTRKQVLLHSINNNFHIVILFSLLFLVVFTPWL